jgi:hypothetical protein
MVKFDSLASVRLGNAHPGNWGLEVVVSDSGAVAVKVPSVVTNFLALETCFSCGLQGKNHLV